MAPAAASLDCYPSSFISKVSDLVAGRARTPPDPIWVNVAGSYDLHGRRTCNTEVSMFIHKQAITASTLGDLAGRRTAKAMEQDVSGLFSLYCSLQSVRLLRLSNRSKVNSTEECSLPPLTSDSWMEARVGSQEVVPVHVHVETYEIAAGSRITAISAAQSVEQKGNQVPFH